MVTLVSMETSTGPHPSLSPTVWLLSRGRSLFFVNISAYSHLEKAMKCRGNNQERGGNILYIFIHAHLHSCVWLVETPRTIAHQIPLSMVSIRQEYWSDCTSSSKTSSQPRDWTHVSCIGRQILYHWATWEALHHPLQQSSLVFQKLFCRNLSKVAGEVVLTLISIPSSLLAHMVKNSTAMLETCVETLSQEVPLNKQMTSNSSILAWRIPS